MKRLISTIILIQLTFLHADNYSLSFDGTDDYVDFGDDDDFRIGGHLTRPVIRRKTLLFH